METVGGYIEHIVYRNEETGYAVAEIVDEGKELTIVGILPQIDEGEYIDAEGMRTMHPLYGEQFSVQCCQIRVPED